MAAKARPGKQFLVLLAVLAVLAMPFLLFGDEIARVFGSENAIQEIVRAWGSWGPIVFLVINALQVIVAPIPGTAVGVAGGYLFGFWAGFALNMAGILIGSLAAFALARAFGKPLVDRLVSERTRQFLERVAQRNGVRGLTLIFLLPFLPDDALCLMAGLTPISYRTFMAIVLIGRSPGSFVASLTGSGLVELPLWAWVIVGVVSLTLITVWWVKGDQIEDWFRQRLVSTPKEQQE